LALALDVNKPLLERLRFVTIVSSNLDEFFEVRVAGVQQRKFLDLSLRTPDHLTPRELLSAIQERTQALVREQYRILNEIILPDLEKEGVRILRRSEWNEEQKKWLLDYFVSQVAPVLTPIGLDPAHPFPNVQNKSLNFVMSLNGTDAFGRESDIAILQVPRCLPRIIKLPNSNGDFILLSSIIHAHIDILFQGMSVTGCYQFRVTRNAEMWVDEEEVDDLLIALKGQLHGRNYGSAVRLEVADNCPEWMVQHLLIHHELDQSDLFQVNGPVNLHRLGSLVGLIDRPDLKFPLFTPGVPEKLRSGINIFSLLRQEDILLHHPYRSFTPVVELLRLASEDPDVLAIKMTLYRVGAHSPLVDALIEAARAGKDVTAVVELRARFDEADNIKFAQRLNKAGAKVVYGVVNYKCHAKLLLIVRREGLKLRRYAHIGTGNYHIGNARLYTDYSLMTSHSEITEDVHNIFMQLTGLGKVISMNKIVQAPFSLYKSLLEWIDNEKEIAKSGKPARIIAKMNSLTEPNVIRALYEASQEGVQVDLIVRGICSLRPGIPGISENIRVRSIIGRFLEHHRIYAFSSGSVYIASSDWMDRNLHRRVEICCPILEPKLRDRILYELNEIFLKDNSQAWEMHSNGTYSLQQNQNSLFSSQQTFLQQLSDE
jgi:polyphosphate kinase